MEEHAGTNGAHQEGTPTGGFQRRRLLVTLDSRKRNECDQPGQIAWSCPNRDALMPTASASEVAGGRTSNTSTTCWAEESGPSPVTPVRANGKDTTGSMVTLIQPDFAQYATLTNTVAITCIHSDTHCRKWTIQSQRNPPKLPEGDLAEASQEEVEASLNKMFPMDQEVPLPASLAGPFGRAQLEDPNLPPASYCSGRKTN